VAGGVDHREKRPGPAMMPDFELRLRNYAEVIVRIGLNLQRGQRLLIAEPYELQGVARSAEAMVEAIKAVALEAGGSTHTSIETIWGDGGRLREFALKRDWGGLARLVAANAEKMNEYVQRGDALLFLLGSQPRLMEGIAAKQVAELRGIGSEYFGGVAQQLMQGATNWTAAPAPAPDWADVVYADQPADQRLPLLWETIFGAMRIAKRAPLPSDRPNASASAEAVLGDWRLHLQALNKRRDELNARRFKTLSYQGEGTDLPVTLPDEHRWCTASLRSKSGVAFVANLPTEEVFTLPHKNSAQGTVRIARPVTFGGTVIEGIELEFQNGRVVKAAAKTGETLLQCLLETDEGAGRLGEVAIVDANTRGGDSSDPLAAAWQKHRFFRHALLDENASSHIALGEGYGFCLKSPNVAALNRSLIHVDLPIAAKANLRT
jgi:aminopeptidase